MGDALDLVCKASTALAASIRQTAGWLGHASAQSATPAKLQQVCLRLLAATHPTMFWASHPNNNSVMRANTFLLANVNVKTQQSCL